MKLTHFIPICIVLQIATANLYATTTTTLYENNGDKSFSIGKYKQALKSYQSASSITTNKVELHIKIAHCFLYLGILDSAMSISNEILSNNSKNIEALLIKSEVFNSKNKFTESLKIYQKIKLLDPLNPKMLHDKEIVLRKMEKKKVSKL